MKNLKFSRLLICALLAAAILIMAGCGGAEQTADPGIADGTYVASFTTDNSMFHVNEADEGKGVLTVANDGEQFDRNSAAGPAEGHYGISGMEERAARIGGRLSFGRKGAWTTVKLEVRP